MPVYFQEVIFHNSTSMSVDVWTDDGGSSGEVKRGSVGGHDSRSLHVGLTNCRALTISVGDSVHSKLPYSLSTGQGDPTLYFETMEVTYLVGKLTAKASALTAD